jgi:predicted RNase H-like HicB family nuclease
MYRFLVVIERAGKNYSAYSPDLPGCVATGETHEEVERNIHEAIQMHLQGLREDNLPIPKGESSAEYIAVH